MSATATFAEQDAFVEAELNYLAPMSERPRSYTFEPPAGTARTNIVNDPHRVAIHDARPQAGDYALDRRGFALLDHRSKVTSFDDESVIRGIYYREAEDLLKQVTGADRVFTHTGNSTKSIGIRSHWYSRLP